MVDKHCYAIFSMCDNLSSLFFLSVEMRESTRVKYSARTDDAAVFCYLIGRSALSCSLIGQSTKNLQSMPSRHKLCYYFSDPSFFSPTSL